MSERNKENRAKQDMGHIAGTKSFARISYDSRDPETGEELNRTELWLTTKFSMKRNDWAGRRSGEVYSDLKRLEAQSMEEGATPMTEDQRFEAVLGPEKSGYKRGCGAGPKPTTSTAGQRIRAQLEKENEELKRQAETNRMRWESLEKENIDLASRLESLESNIHVEIQTQVHDVLQTQITTFFQQMKESGQILTSLHCDRVQTSGSSENSFGRLASED